MSKLQKFNICFKVGLLFIVIVGSILIYLYQNPINIGFWIILFFSWIFSYRPIVNKFFYQNEMNKVASKLEVLSEILFDLLDWENQKKKEPEQDRDKEKQES